MEQKQQYPGNKTIGSIGERLAAQYLREQGQTVIGMNYWKKWGEIDVITKKDKKIHFIEVKSVSYGTKDALIEAISQETWRPEENVHAHKLAKLARVIDTWIREHNWTGDWQIDVAAVRMVSKESYASINLIENIIID